jgi:ribosomal protein S3
MRYFRYILKHFFLPLFVKLGVRGVKMQLSGKISVGGNSRTRTIRHKTGQTSHTSITNKILTVLRLIPTFTGVQGFKI